MRSVLLLAAVTVALAAPAFAQTSDRNASAQAFSRACIASPQMSGYANPEPSCACAAGVLSGQTTDRQFYIAGRLTSFANDNAGMRSEAQRMVAEGYRPEEILEVGNIMTAASVVVTNTCSAFER